MAACPSCDGEGYFSAFVDWHENGRLVGELRHGIKCTLCDGSGKISDAARLKHDTGRQLRNVRVISMKSLREAAQALGTTPAELSKWERGQCGDSDLMRYREWLLTLERAA